MSPGMGTGITISLGVSVGGGGGFDYYVDSVNGSDANDGTSAATAFASIGSLPALTGGEHIGLARGSHWREQLDISANNITVAAYGTGDDPLLDASDVITSWAKTEGQTNVYQATVDADIASVNTWVNVWEGDAFLSRASSIADCDATPGSYYPSADTGTGPITLYVHPTGSTNPTTDGKTYEVSTRRYSVNAFQRSGITLHNIRTRRNLHNDGSIVVGRNARIYNCTAEDGGKHNVYFEDGSYLENVTARNGYYGGGGLTLFIGYDTDPTGAGFTLVDCTATMDTYTPSSNGYYDHFGGSGNFGTVSYRGCCANNVSTAFASLGATLLRLDNCIVTACRQGVQVEVPTEITGGSYSVNDLTSPAPSKCIELGSSSTTLTVDGAEFGTDRANGIIVQCTQASKSLDIQNCTFPAGSYPLFLTGTGISLDFYYNTLGDVTYCIRIEAGYTLAADYNTYGTGTFRIGGTEYTWSAYRAAFPQLDANSTHP